MSGFYAVADRAAGVLDYKDAQGGERVADEPRGYEEEEEPRRPPAVPVSEPAVREAFTPNAMARGSGVVSKILPDDNKGSRHQRFILRLPSGRTLLIAHNIDIARRIASLKKGDAVSFYGEYEEGPQGGVIHWTHHDPKGRHVGGWLRHGGTVYQ